MQARSRITRGLVRAIGAGLLLGVTAAGTEAWGAAPLGPTWSARPGTWRETALAIVGLVVALMHFVRHRRLMRAIVPEARETPLASLPALTIVRPSKGLDWGARANLEAWLATRYPGPLQLLAVLDDASDPAFELVREAVARARASGVDAELILCGPPPPQRTGKLHAMIAGMSRARGELIGFSDSDTRPAPTLFAALARELVSRPDAGAVFAPAVVISDGAMTLGDAGHALLLNTWYGPVAALAAGARRELPFIMGQAMVVSRAALEAAGGLACAEGHLVDDMRIGTCLAAEGFRNVQSTRRLPIVAGGHSWGAFVHTFRRWLLFSRGGLPAAFVELHVTKGLLWGLGTAGLVASVAIQSKAGAVAGLLCAATFVACELAQYRAFAQTSLPSRHAWLAFVMPLVGAWAMALARLGTSVDWRGREYRLDDAARLSRSARATRGARAFAAATGLKSTAAARRS